MALFDPVFSANDDLTRFGVFEAEDLLSCERHDEDRYFILEHLTSSELWTGIGLGCAEMEIGILWTHVDLSDVEDFAGADKTSTEVHLHRGPKNVVRLFEHLSIP